jgi:16S rRNA (guanine527-N7)-methyltransferase
MEESEARQWLSDTFSVSRETWERLEAFIALLRDENGYQNLISSASLDELWNRHIVDSAQLIRFAPSDADTWLDLGTGAGFPGLIVAMLHRSKVTMVEARRLRVDFLHRAAAVLALPDHALISGSIARFDAPPFDVISARAFAPLDKLLSLGERFSTPATRWILPKGRNAKSELEAVESSWQGDFRLEPSLTDADAEIIVASGVSRRRKGKRAR